MQTETIQEKQEKPRKLITLKDLSAMSKREARVLVAKDVLNGIRAKLYQAEPGVYCRQIYDLYEEAKPGDDVRQLLGMRKCDVCAVGAAAVAFVRRFDGVKFSGDGYNGDPVMQSEHGIASKIFPERMRQQMEDAFEVEGLFNFDGEIDFYGNRPTKAQKFGVQFRDPQKRLRAIFQNIVDNDGDFKP